MSFATVLAACTGWEEVDFPGYGNEGMLFAQADATVKSCPEINYYTVSPLQTSVGGTLQLRVSASSPAGPLLVLWTGTGGTVKEPKAFETSYTCEVVGPQKIEINIRGNGCVRTQRIDVTCVDQ